MSAVPIQTHWILLNRAITKWKLQMLTTTSCFARLIVWSRWNAYPCYQHNRPAKNLRNASVTFFSQRFWSWWTICARPTKHQRTCLLSSTRLLARVLSLSLLKCQKWTYRESKPKSCCLDPLPTRVLKQSTDVLANPITEIINTSLKTGVFPTSLKKGNVQPLIKKRSETRLRGVF